MLRQPTEPAEPMEPAGPAEADGELQAVLFDMDGLLVDSEPLWFEVECSVMARLDGRWSEADQQALIGGSLPRTVAYLLERAGRPASAEDGRPLAGGRDDLAADVAEAAGPARAPASCWPRCAPRGSPARWSPPRSARSWTPCCGSSDVAFSATVCADDVTRGKPDPEPYLRAASLLGADPRRCVALEDSPNGVASAEAAGCRTVAVPSLVPIAARPGRVVAGSLSQVEPRPAARPRGRALAARRCGPGRVPGPARSGYVRR